MPNARDTVEFVQNISTVIHETPHNSGATPPIFQLFWTEPVVQLPPVEELFELTAWHHPDRRSSGIFRWVVSEGG